MGSFTAYVDFLFSSFLDLLWREWPPFPIRSNQIQRSKLLTGNPRLMQMASPTFKKANKLLLQVSTTLVQLAWLNIMVLTFPTPFVEQNWQ